MGEELTNRQKVTLKFARLSWKILEHKFRYYLGDSYENAKPISDDKYDEIESLYKKLAVALKVEPTASNHVGFPSDTPSGRLVMSKFILKGKTKKALSV